MQVYAGVTSKLRLLPAKKTSLISRLVRMFSLLQYFPCSLKHFRYTYATIWFFSHRMILMTVPIKFLEGQYVLNVLQTSLHTDAIYAVVKTLLLVFRNEEELGFWLSLQPWLSHNSLSWVQSQALQGGQLCPMTSDPQGWCVTEELASELKI